MATSGRKYTASFDTTPGNVRQRKVTRANAAAGDLTALSTATVAVITDNDATTQAGKNEILAALDAIARRISRDFGGVTSPSGLDTVTGASFE
jgi:transcriptional regulator of nitric oxide reductase